MKRLALALLLVFAAAGGTGRAADQPGQGAGRQGGAGPEAAAGGGSVSGVVLDEETKQPIAEAIVVMGDVRHLVGRLLTDSMGRFLFRNVPASGGYQLSASKQGYFSGSNGPPIAIAEGQWIPDVRVALTRPSSIAGTLTDESGEPVVGARIRVLPRLFVAGQARLVAGPTTRTDDRGAYRIGGLEAGTYLVEVPSIQNTVIGDANAAAVTAAGAPVDTSRLRDDTALDLDPVNRLIIGNYPAPAAEPGRPAAYPVTFYPSTAVAAESAPIELGRAQDRHGIDIRLQPVRAWRVAGRVVGPSGATGAGMLLRLAPPGLEDFGPGNETATTVVDREGRFAFLNVPEGRYTIDARVSFLEYGYNTNAIGALAPMPTPGLLGRGGSSGGAGNNVTFSATNTAGVPLSGRADVVVDGRDIADVTLTLQRSASISGRVLVDSGDGRGGTAPGQGGGMLPLFITFQPADGSPSLGLPSVRADQATGVFSAAGFGRGRYVVWPLGQGVRSITVGGKDVTRAAIDMTSGQDITDMVITLSTKAGTVTGSVRAIPKDGAAVVIVFPADPEQWSGYGFQSPRLKSVLVSTAGGFSVSTEAGDVLLVAVPAAMRDRWRDPAFLQAASAVATRVTLEWGVTKTLDLKMTSELK